MRRAARRGSEPIVSVYRGFWRVVKAARPAGGSCLAMLALCAVALMGGDSLAQGVSEQQIRCMQLQQELAAAQGGGANREELPRIDQQIAQADRVFQGTRAAMEDAGCFESFFIFGRGLVRSPKCLKMNDRVEDARRQLTQLQQQRQALTGGGGNKRRQAELQDALARSGCGGQVRQPRRGGGLFDFFGGGQEEEQLPQTPIYRSIDPNGRYRSVCVRLCDGFFYPIHFSTYGSLLGQDAQQCQSNCAAPAELYVYRNPGQDIEQAVSLNGSAYMDLPVALRFRKEYVTGCSCKQAEYNPTEIEASNKKAEVDATGKPAKGKPTAAATPAPEAAPAPQAAVPAGDQALDLDVTGSNEPAPPPAPEAAPTAIPEEQQPAPPPPVEEAAAPPPPPPAPPPAAAVNPPAPPPAPPPAAAAAPPPTAAATGDPAGQSTVAKRKTAPPPPPASGFGPQF
jgi:Protein of unknown function (DUF2865)